MNQELEVTVNDDEMRPEYDFQVEFVGSTMKPTCTLVMSWFLIQMSQRSFEIQLPLMKPCD
jgi:hypothetical protein